MRSCVCVCVCVCERVCAHSVLEQVDEKWCEYGTVAVINWCDDIMLRYGVYLWPEHIGKGDSDLFLAGCVCVCVFVCMCVFLWV